MAKMNIKVSGIVDASFENRTRYALEIARISQTALNILSSIAPIVMCPRNKKSCAPVIPPVFPELWATVSTIGPPSLTRRLVYE